jgi:hypothetical protein
VTALADPVRGGVDGLSTIGQTHRLGDVQGSSPSLDLPDGVAQHEFEVIEECGQVFAGRGDVFHGHHEIAASRDELLSIVVFHDRNRNRGAPLGLPDRGLR